LRTAEAVITIPPGLTTEGLVGRRYMARFIDSVVLVILVGAVIAAGSIIPAALLLIPVVWFGYGTALESSPWQATVGKRITGLKVYMENGGRLGFIQAAQRNLIKDAPFLLFALFSIGNILSMLWLVAHVAVLHRSPVYQAIQDRAAHTWVAAPEETTRLNLS
jgi:uncharacterized RDD family membrane protein YckC